MKNQEEGGEREDGWTEAETDEGENVFERTVID